jgi:hypothetical protein
MATVESEHNKNIMSRIRMSVVEGITAEHSTFVCCAVIFNIKCENENTNAHGDGSVA